MVKQKQVYATGLTMTDNSTIFQQPNYQRFLVVIRHSAVMNNQSKRLTLTAVMNNQSISSTLTDNPTIFQEPNLVRCHFVRLYLFQRFLVVRQSAMMKIQ